MGLKFFHTSSERTSAQQQNNSKQLIRIKRRQGFTFLKHKLLRIQLVDDQRGDRGKTRKK